MKKIENLFERQDKEGVTFQQQEQAPEEEELDAETRLRAEELARQVAAEMGLSLEG